LSFVICHLSFVICHFAGVKKYSCQQCDKCFLQRHDLRKHLRVHTGNHCPKLDIVFVELVPTGRMAGRIIQKLKKEFKSGGKVGIKCESALATALLSVGDWNILSGADNT
jgi:hypothetical protein